MLRNGRSKMWALLAPWLAATWLLAAAPPANAGCGCDHPPPAWAPVMPPFASPGHKVLVWVDGSVLTAGQSYDVVFGSNAGAKGVALTPDTLVVAVPSLSPGPASILVKTSRKSSVTIGSENFTMLVRPPVVPATGGAFADVQFQASVASDGTLLLPINVRHVFDAMQLAFVITDLAYAFGPDDVTVYNMDGFDLTLFTLATSDPTVRQWGSYYGFDVESDTNLIGTVYDHKTVASSNPAKSSDVLTYWRHEYHTYRSAHDPYDPKGGYSVDVNGLHPDGTAHVNHGHLVIAIAGMKRSADNPLDPSAVFPLSPGTQKIDFRMLALPAAGPIEPADVVRALDTTTSFGSFQSPESHFNEFEGMFSRKGGGPK